LTLRTKLMRLQTILFPDLGNSDRRHCSLLPVFITVDDGAGLFVEFGN
jgi:hypothetical protein